MCATAAIELDTSLVIVQKVDQVVEDMSVVDPVINKNVTNATDLGILLVSARRSRTAVTGAMVLDTLPVIASRAPVNHLATTAIKLVILHVSALILLHQGPLVTTAAKLGILLVTVHLVAVRLVISAGKQVT